MAARLNRGRRRGTARLYRLPNAKAGWVCATLACASVVAGITLLVGPRLGLLPTLGGALFGVVAALLSFDRHAVVVGTDGVLHRDGLTQRFARYANISAIHHLAPGTERNHDPHWVIELRLASGIALRIGTTTEPHDRLGRHMVRRIRRRRHGALADGDHAQVEELLLRKGRRVDEWRDALDRLRDHLTQTYRSAVSPEELWLVLADEGAKLTARVGAALVLGEPRALRRVKRIAESVADPVTKRVLRRLVSDDDPARHAALEALHDEGVLLRMGEARLRARRAR
jgi:hypothetical protein